MVKTNKKRNVIIGFTVEDYKKLAEVCEITYRSKTHFIKKVLMPEVEKILKEAKKKNGTSTD